MAAPAFVQVERSFVQPGLRSLAVTRCPAAVQPRAPLPFEPPEVVAPEGPWGAKDSGAAGAEAADLRAHHADAVGGNVLVGGAYGLCSHLARPGLQRVARNAGDLGPVVRVGGEAGLFAIATLIGAALTKTASRVGSVVSRIPLVGGGSAVGTALQFGLASFVGDKLGEILMGGRGEDPAAPDIFLSQVCVMCNSAFEMGSGQRVAALACGHACLCGSEEAGAESCADVYLAQRADCPLCRRQPVDVAHTVLI